MGLFSGLKNFFRGQADKASEALEDVERDSKFAIEDSKTQVAGFQSKIATIMAANKIALRKRNEAEEEVAKLQRMAERAGSDGDADATRALVEKKSAAQRNLDTLTNQVTANEKIIKQLRGQLDGTRTKIANAESNRGRLVAQLEGAKIRKEMAAASSQFAGSSPLASLDKLQTAVEEAEADAEVTEELVGAEDTSSALTEKYGDDANAEDDEIARLLGKPTGTSS